jgi:hypothetical protein
MGDDSVEQFWYIFWLIKAILLLCCIGFRPYPVEWCKAGFVQTVNRAFAWHTAVLWELGCFGV